MSLLDLKLTADWLRLVADQEAACAGHMGKLV